jgi:hypothetical protein
MAGGGQGGPAGRTGPSHPVNYQKNDLEEDFVWDYANDYAVRSRRDGNPSNAYPSSVEPRGGAAKKTKQTAEEAEADARHTNFRIKGEEGAYLLGPGGTPARAPEIALDYFPRTERERKASRESQGETFVVNVGGMASTMLDLKKGRKLVNPFERVVDDFDKNSNAARVSNKQYIFFS